MIRFDEDGQPIEPVHPTCGDATCGCRLCIDRRCRIAAHDPVRATYGPFSEREIWYAGRASFSMETIRRGDMVFVVQRGPVKPEAVVWIEEMRERDRIAPRPGIRIESTLEETMATIDVNPCSNMEGTAA